MTPIDLGDWQGILTAVTALIAAMVGLWNAIAASTLSKRIDKTNEQLKALWRAQGLDG